MKRMLLLLVSLFILPLAHGQEPEGPPPTPAPTKKASSRATTRTLKATIVKLDVAGRAVTLKTQGGDQEILARADELTEFFKEGKPAKLDAFAEGEAVTARVTLKGQATTGTLKTLLDEATVKARDDQKKQAVSGTVVVSTLTNLDVKLEGGEVRSYRINDRTIYVKGEKRVKATDFTPGEPVAVQPRAIGVGVAQAVIVAESLKALPIARNDTLSTWSGVIEKVEGDTLTLKRDDGAVRTLKLADNLSVMRGKKALEKSDLKAGAKVKAHLVKGEPGEDGQRTTDKLTLAAR